MRNKGMRLAAALLLLSSLAVPSAYTSAAAKSVKAKVKVKVTLVSMELTENNHVGNEWYTAGYINDKEIKEGSSVVLDLKATESIKLKGYVEEQDKIPDKGETVSTIKVSELSKPVTKAVKVTVTENRGRYSGNTATWKFTFKVQKQ
ncbi:hypothetical protein [Paenibacillus sp. FSL R7-0331]|uniref:hypothetical protein n=1 Tax=Paenibacillus sp. FSL R7-0331 TaxID=1536773 RepID=UPI0004F7D1AB|nr:hypothetical protein [Paenibacillus sp. FSL R7-0331]AIQ51012.1 hypothetical protein R70331_05415 [Paenibacillus sp. FSL R7-0331]